MITLYGNQIHLWWTFPECNRDAAVQRRQFLSLSATEQDRHHRFRFECHRQEYLVSHALVRDALSRYAPVDPQDWQFTANAYGRPSIKEPEEFRWLRFNLSHTQGKAVVALRREMDVGVDVENTNTHAHSGEFSELLDQHFSPYELIHLEHHPDTFFDFWTLKEAYVKAKGTGLVMPLDNFSFSLADPEQPRITFRTGCQGQSDRWWFMLRRAEDYRLALAACIDTTEVLQVTEQEIVPLAGGVGRSPPR